MASRSAQRGVALITVLLVFALAAIIASDVASRIYRDIRKTGNLINSKQAYHYALAGEQFARQILFRDYRDEKERHVDTLTDTWANIGEIFDIEDGVMTIEIVDSQSKFNINNLVDDRGRANLSTLSAFRRLLSLLKVDESVAAKLVDWQDLNRITLKDGAEDEVYQPLGYLAANQPMADRTELRLLHDLSITDYNKLKDYVVALPLEVDGKKIAPTKYNLNTLDAKIIEALSSSGNSGDAAKITAQQKKGGYDSLSTWSANGYFQPLAESRDQLGVNSEFFEIKIKVKYDQRVSVLRTQLYRDSSDGKITLLKRQQGIE
ncbi:MAG: type II secretion system minor pseudopilin GspK [Oceanicoccus sp.]